MAKKNQGKTSTPKKAETPKPADSRLRLLWIGTLIVLCSLMIYNKRQTTDVETEGPAAVEAPGFDISAWFEGYYQEKMEAFLKNDSRLGKDLLPIKNQLDFDVFGKYNMEDYIRGKRDYLLSESGIYTYLGKNYVGDSVISENVRKLKVISDTLRKKNIDLLVLFAPTKEYAMPELIPDKYLKYPTHKNTYEAYLEGFRQAGIHHMDLLPFVHHLRAKYNYPIYPQYGTHLSYFTECMVADTTIKFIEHMRGVQMPHIGWQKIEYPAAPKMRDADAIGKAKLEFPPKSIPMAYPTINYSTTANARPVKTLGIGDSYYRSFMYLGVAQIPFNNGEYWYYYNSVVPETPDKREVWEYNLKSKLEENEVIILYYASGNLYRLGDGFIDDAYQLYTNPAAYYARIKKEAPIKRKIKEVHQDPELLQQAERNAKKLSIPLDSAIKLEAEAAE